MQNAVGPTERTSNDTHTKEKTQLMQAPKALEQYDVSSTHTQKTEPDALMFRGDCFPNTLLHYSGWYYWMRQIKGLQGFWQVDKCCLTRQSAGQTVQCSLTALTLHPTATKGFELIWHVYSHTHTWRTMGLFPRMWPLSVSEAGSRTALFPFRLVNHGKDYWGTPAGYYPTICCIPASFVWRLFLNLWE